MATATPVARRESPSTRLRRRFKRFRRWLIAVVARALVVVVAPLPFGLTRRLFPFVTGIFATPLLRRTIEEQLVLAYGDELDPAERRAIRRRVCRNIGLLVAEILALSRDKLPDGYIDYEAALDRLDRVVGPDRGFIALSAHLGNWECLGWLMYQRWPDRAAAVIARRNANEHLNALIESARKGLSMETIYQDDSPRRALRLLRDGKVVATVPDQDIARIAGIFVPFFGKPAYTPAGPAALAYMADVPLCFGFARRTDTGLVLECPDPIWPDKSRPKDEEIERLTREWSAVVEAQIRKQPSDWMWFHRRWRTTPERLAARRERKKREAERARESA